MQALILCGGLGKRLRSISGDLPKPLVPIAGKTVLDRQLDVLERNGISQVILIAGYRADLFERHLEQNPRPFPVRVLTEKGAYGTAGTVCAELDEFAERFFVLYGDVVFDIDLKRLLDFHLARRADATLFLHPNDHPEDSDLVDVDGMNAIQGFFASPHPSDLLYRNLVNAGLYLIESKALSRAGVPSGTGTKLDFVKDVFPAMLNHGASLFGYESREYIKDMGTPDRYAKVEGSCEVSGRAFCLEPPITGCLPRSRWDLIAIHGLCPFARAISAFRGNRGGSKPAQPSGVPVGCHQ